MSQQDFINQWCAQVSLIFGLEYRTCTGLYKPDDQYNTNMNTRAMWKFASNKGVSGTPTAYLNGVRLENMPGTVDDWLQLLQQTYDSQFS